MVPSKLTVTGFDEHCVYLRTTEGQEVFVEWREIPIGEAMSIDAVRTAAGELGDIRRQALAQGLEAIRKALTVVTGVDDQRKLQGAYRSLSQWPGAPVVGQD